MAAPFADRTRLDAALDAAVAVAAVADVLGDRCGAIAFAGEVLRSLPPRRAGARDVVSALFDLEPVPVESDYELAFAQIRGVKRAFVLVFTDLLEESAAQPLVEALPVLARRHAVAVAGSADPDLDAAVRSEPQAPGDVYRAARAPRALPAPARPAARLQHTGATVVEAPPAMLAASCVRTYLRAKWLARLGRVRARARGPSRRRRCRRRCRSRRRGRPPTGSRGPPQRSRRSRATAPSRAQAAPPRRPRAEARPGGCPARARRSTSRGSGPPLRRRGCRTARGRRARSR